MPRTRMWRLVLLLAMLAMIYSAESLARALLAVLLLNHPLLLISLDSSAHDVLLAGLKLPVAEVFAVAVTWRFAVHFVHYLLGLWYGDAALGWIGKKFSFAGLLIEKVESIFSRFAKPAVFLFSDNVVCLLAGATGMRLVPFIVLHLAGTALHIWVLVLVIQHAHGPLAQIVTFIDNDVTVLTVLFVIATVVSIAIAVTARRSQIRDLAAAWQSRAKQQDSAASDSEDNGQEPTTR